MQTKAMDVTALFRIFAWKQEGEKIEIKKLCFKILDIKAHNLNSTKFFLESGKIFLNFVS